MIERLLEFRTVINAMVSNVYEMRDEYGNTEKYKIPALNFEDLQILVEALKLLAELTKKLFLRDASVADILPIYYVSMSKWPPSKSIEENKVGQLRQKITIGLDKRMKEMKKLIIATILDPRYKVNVFSMHDRTNVIRLVLDELKKIEPTLSDNTNSPPFKRTKNFEDSDFMESYLDEMDDGQTEDSSSNSIEKELNDYLSEARISYNADPSAVLDYWNVSSY